jgi:hypothetical protein
VDPHRSKDREVGAAMSGGHDPPPPSVFREPGHVRAPEADETYDPPPPPVLARDDEAEHDDHSR